MISIPDFFLLKSFTLGSAAGSRTIEFGSKEGALRRLILRVTAAIDCPAAGAGATVTTQLVWGGIVNTLAYHSGDPMFAGLTLQDICVFEAHQSGNSVPTATSGAIVAGATGSLTFDVVLSFYDSRKGPNANDFCPRAKEINELRMTFSNPSAAPADWNVTDWTIACYIEVDPHDDIIGVRRNLYIDSENDVSPDIGGNGSFITDLLVVGAWTAYFAATPNVSLSLGSDYLYADFAGDLLPLSSAYAQDGYGAGSRSATAYFQPLLYRGAYYKNSDVEQGQYKVRWSAAPSASVRVLVCEIVPNTADKLRQRFPDVFSLSGDVVGKLVQPSVAKPGAVPMSLLSLLPLKFAPKSGVDMSAANKAATQLGSKLTASKMKPQMNKNLPGYIITV